MPKVDPHTVLVLAEQALETEWTADARRVYRFVFGDKLPKKWEFWWNTEGATIRASDVGKRRCAIIMDRGLQTKRQYETLIHEFFHVRGFNHCPMYDEAIRVIANLYWKLRKSQSTAKIINKMLGKHALPTRRFKPSR